MSEQRTEKPTQQRLRKAREKGQFPAAKEMVSAAQFFVLAIVTTSWIAAWFDSAERGFARALLIGFERDINPENLTYTVRSLVLGTFLPLAPAAGIVLGVTLLFQLAFTNIGVSLNKLTPSLQRFNPASRLKEIPRQNLPAMIQAVLVFVIVGYMVYSIGVENLPVLLTLPMASVQTGVSVIGSALGQVLWRTAGLLLLIGTVEFFRHRWLYNKDLSMTKQEIRQEHKDQEGDPHIKARVRKLRRDLLRRQMMKEVPTATAVIVNPTHYAVAIRYDQETMASPRVVAKGRNYLALRIRQKAADHGVLVIENPPLARALYQSVEVGHEIPPDFYRAVAEILAYVYRVMGTRRNTR